MGEEKLLRAGQVAASVAAGGFIVQTALVLTQTTGLLGRAPELVKTSASREVDYATYFAGFFNYQHSIVWNVALRDAIGPVAWVAVATLAVLTAVLVRSTRAVVTALIISLGAALAALADLVFGTLVGFWRYGGWNTEVPSDMIATGRSYQGIKTLSTYLQYDGFVVVAVGLALLATLTGWTLILQRLLWLTALGLVAYVVLSWLWPIWHGTEIPTDLLAFGLGVLLAPGLAMLWARDLRRHAARFTPLRETPTL